MKTYFSKLLLITLLVLLLLAGCEERVRTAQISDDWGRAARIGVAGQSVSVGLAVTPGGDRVALVWPKLYAERDQEFIHLLILDDQGTILVDQDLEPAVEDLAQVQLLMDQAGQLQLVWNAGTWQERQLWHAYLASVYDLENAALSPVSGSQLSIAETPVRWFKSAMFASGEPLVLWLDADGCLIGVFDGENSGCMLTDVLGVDFQLEPTGLLRLVWSSQASISRLTLHEALLDPTTLKLTDVRTITTVVIPGGAQPDAIDGPILSMETGFRYASWTQTVSSLVGTSEFLYTVAIPEGWDGVEELEAQQINILPVFPPPAGPATSDYFSYRSLSSPAGSQMYSTSVNRLPTTLSSQGDEVVLVTSAQYNTRSRQEYQPTLVYLRAGEYMGYQAVTWTDYPSVRPVVAADADQQLYVAWVDGVGVAGHYPVYLASTAPGLRTAWQQLTSDDYLTIAGDYSTRISQGVFILMFAIFWILIPFAWFMLSMWIFHGELYGGRGRLVLLVALLLYVGSKYLLTAEILTYIPALAYLPADSGSAVINLFPICSLLVSTLLVGWFYIRRAGDDFSALKSYMLIALLDWIVSIVVYSIGYFE